MANPEHLAILKKGVAAWNEWQMQHLHIQPDLSRADLSGRDLNRVELDGANLRKANLSGANLSEASLKGAYLREVDLSGADLSGAHLDGAEFNWAQFGAADLSEADLSWADLSQANLVSAKLIKANLNGANLESVDLRHSQVCGGNLTEATLTGCRLYGSARDDWVIQGVKCRYVFWDAKGEARSPRDRDLAPGEFEQLYRTLPTIEYVFQNGMTPMDPLIMDRVVQAIRERNPGFGIQVDSINARGLAPSIKFTVQREEHKEPALAEVTRIYEAKIAMLEAERDRYYRLVARALDAPREAKLTIVESGAIAAINGSTVSIEQHIRYATELQRAIADDETLSKVAKRKALGVIGGALQDFAKGQVKKAAEQIIELAKDLGPVIVNTAAYAFFRDCLR